MPDSLGSLGAASVGLQLDSNNFESGLGRVTGLLGHFAATTVTAAATAVVGLGVASIKMAGDFEQSTKTLVTGAGESASALGMVSDGMLKLAKDTATSTSDLNAGMFLVESAGFHGAKGLEVLKAAAQGAKVGNADLASVANGVTTAMVDYAGSSLTAAQATNTLIATVAAGKSNMTDLSTAMSTILPTAAAAKVAFTDVSGAMATMTGAGVKAADAATFLKQMFIALQAPNANAIKQLSAIGLTAQDVSTMMQKSLPDTLKLITDRLGKEFPAGSAAYMAAIKDISGGAQNMQAILNLTGSHMQTFIDNTHSIADGTKKAGSAIAGWSTVQGEFNFKIAQAKEFVETLGIQVGTFLIPKVLDLAQAMIGKVQPAISIVSDVLKTLGDDIRPVSRAALEFSHGFDEMDRAVGSVIKGVKAVKQPFDEGSIAVNRMNSVARSLVTPLDEGSRAVNRFVDQSKQVASPLTQIRSIITQVAAFIMGQFIPAFMNIVNIYQKEVLPSFLNLIVFVDKNVLPVLEKFGMWILTKVVPPVVHFVGIIDKNLVPVLEQVWTVISQNVLPIFEKLVDTVVNHVLPPVGKLVTALGTVLVPVFKLVGWVLQNVIGPTLNQTIGWLNGLLDAINWVLGKLGDFLGMLGNVKDAVTGGVFGKAAHALGIPGFAAGSVSTPAGMAVVGEHGPELVNLPQGTIVHTNAESRRMAADTATGGGNKEFHVHVTNEAPSTRDIFNEFRRLEFLYG